MHKAIGVLTAIILLTACSHTYYIVRHAEKAVPSTGGTMNTPDDPPLSEAGTKRAEALKEELKNKNITNIFSTKTIRTTATAEPLSKLTGITIQTYGPVPDSMFIQQLKKIKANTLIVGHSNTVDDIVNGLAGENKFSDLSDSEYDNLFRVKYSRFFGTKIKYLRKKY
jgi:phosphohistidine phosphatase SixA